MTVSNLIFRMQLCNGVEVPETVRSLTLEHQCDKVWHPGEGRQESQRERKEEKNERMKKNKGLNERQLQY